VPRPSVMPCRTSSSFFSSLSNASIRLLICSITSSIPRVIFSNLPLISVLVLLSAIPFNTLQIYAESRIFFATRDAAFAEPSSDLALPEGTEVEIIRGRERQVVGKGEIFRIRPEHVAIQLISGSAREDDIAISSRTTDGQKNNSTRNSYTPLEHEEKPSEMRIVLFRIQNAPKIVADSFDSSFVKALLEQSGFAGGTETRVSLLRVPNDRKVALNRNSISEIGREMNGEIVLIPFFQSKKDDDEIGVIVYSGKNGRKISNYSIRVNIFENLHYLPLNEKIGSLEVVGRYLGLPETPDGMEVNRDGSILMSFSEDLFLLKNGAARYSGRRRKLDLLKKDSTRVAGNNYEITVMKEEGIRGPGEYVEIKLDGNIAFKSDTYSRIHAVSAKKGWIAILLDSGIELLRIQ